MRRPIRLGITTVGMICYSSFAVTAQQTAPTDNRGAHTDVLAVIDLLILLCHSLSMVKAALAAGAT